MRSALVAVLAFDPRSSGFHHKKSVTHTQTNISLQPINERYLLLFLINQLGSVYVMSDCEAFYWRPITQGPKDLRFLTSYNSKGFIWCCTLNTGKCFENILIPREGGGKERIFALCRHIRNDTAEQNLPSNFFFFLNFRKNYEKAINWIYVTVGYYNVWEMAFWIGTETTHDKWISVRSSVRSKFCFRTSWLSPYFCMDWNSRKQKMNKSGFKIRWF